MTSEWVKVKKVSIEMYTNRWANLMAFELFIALSVCQKFDVVSEWLGLDVE